MATEIQTKYNPSEVEDKWYAYWLKHKLFASEPDEREAYTVVIPPPNVTGVLHMGHMLNNSIQDILVRRARMEGKNALWVPGTDHASIATEAKVVAKLAAEGVQKNDISREEFLKEAWDWTHKHGNIIIEQLKKIGASCDWDRLAFTMDEKRSQSVIDVFIDLYNKDLIYRGVRMVNWDPKALTAVSDEEVNHQEEQSKLYYLRYPVQGEEGNYLVIATTRPETILGDTAVCIHPEDKRYTAFKGKQLIVPIANRCIPIIEDEYVDMDFGTACLKVTPAHDVNDYMLGEKHQLESIDIFNDDGSLNQHGLAYAGMDRFQVRKQIVQDLQELGFVEKIEDYTNKVGYSERTNVPIEPKLSTQWFLNVQHLASRAIEAVRDNEVQLVPEKYKNTYFHWMENIKDWCISRQLRWGHRIPAYYLPDSSFVVAKSPEEALELAKAQTANDKLCLEDLKQDEDCLDTWFSSWLWPISVFGNVIAPSEEEERELQYYYPTTDLVTGPDILFFWVARMIMAGYEYRGKQPFRNVFLTGIVRDEKGDKMSKSKGNSPDPLKLIEKYGADGVRMGLMTSATAGNDILFREALCEQGRNFNNKIWNAFRLLNGWETEPSLVPSLTETAAVQWFSNRLSEVNIQLQDHFQKYRLSDALLLLYKLFRDEFSAIYLELVKPGYGEKMAASTKAASIRFFSIQLQLLHPFMPFITEELWQALEERKEGDSIMLHPVEDIQTPDQHLLSEVELAKELISKIRNLRATYSLSPKETLHVHSTASVFSAATVAMIQKLANIELSAELTVGQAEQVDVLMLGTYRFSIPVPQHIDVEAETAKLRQQEEHYLKFLAGVRKKLSNPKFVENAAEHIVALERKKEQDALQKLAAVRERLQSFKA